MDLKSLTAAQKWETQRRPHREEGQCQFLHSSDSNGIQGNGCVRGGSGWISGKDSGPESDQALEQDNCHVLKLLKPKKCLDFALRHRVINSSSSKWSQELDSGILVVSFLPEIFYDSLTVLRFSELFKSTNGKKEYLQGKPLLKRKWITIV